MPSLQSRCPIFAGLIVDSTSASSASTLALNSAASGGYSQTWLAYGVRIGLAKTLSKVQVYASAVTGTLGPSDLVCDVYSSSVGAPSASLQSSSTVTATPVTGTPAWVEFTGFTQSLAAGTQYWLVLRNANPTNTTLNYPTYQYGGGGSLPYAVGGGTSHTGWGAATSTNGGGSWSNIRSSCGWRLQFSDGTYAGFPVQSFASSVERAYGSNEVGVRFTIPPGAKWNVSGASFYAQLVGSPTGKLVYNLYQNGAYVTQTLGLIGSNDIIIPGFAPDCFPSTVTLNPGDVVTITIANTAADSNTAAYGAGAEYRFATDANTQALMPFEGTLQKVTCSNGIYGGTTSPTFVVPSTQAVIPFALLLDTAGEFAATGGGVGGGVPRIGPALIGGICG